MATTPEPAIEGIRGIAVYCGLGTPAARAFVVGTMVGLAAYAVKQPAMSFDEEGKMRPLALVSKAPTATNAHFLAVPLTAAAAAFLFT